MAAKPAPSEHLKIEHKESRLAILVGAGASYGAGAITPYPPPLGNQLFDELARYYPQSWGQLPTEYQSMLRADFETGMDELWNHPDLAPSRLFIDMGVYFTRFDPPYDGSDCYSQLIRGLQLRGLVDRTVIASLNYECVLDCTVKPLGLLLAYLGDVPPPGNIMILKPHGACNLIPQANVYGVALVAAGGSSGFYDGGLPQIPMSLPAVRELYANDFALPPMMSMYTRNKHSPVGRTFLDLTRRKWREWLDTCSVILVIGARPVLWDEHIWTPIIDSPAQVWFVGGKDTNYEELNKQLGSRLHYVGATFRDSMPALVRRLDDLT